MPADYRHIRTQVVPQQRITIASERVTEELPSEHGPIVRQHTCRTTALHDCTVVVEVDEPWLQRLIMRAIYNAGRQARQGPVRVRVTKLQEIPDSRVEETV